VKIKGDPHEKLLAVSVLALLFTVCACSAQQNAVDAPEPEALSSEAVERAEGQDGDAALSAATESEVPGAPDESNAGGSSPGSAALRAPSSRAAGTRAQEKSKGKFRSYTGRSAAPDSVRFVAGSPSAVAVEFFDLLGKGEMLATGPLMGEDYTEGGAYEMDSYDKLFSMLLSTITASVTGERIEGDQAYVDLVVSMPTEESLLQGFDEEYEAYCDDAYMRDDEAFVLDFFGRRFSRDLPRATYETYMAFTRKEGMWLINPYSYSPYSYGSGDYGGDFFRIFAEAYGQVADNIY